MSAYELLWWLLGVEVIVILSAVVLIFGHGSWMTAFERRAAPRLEQGRTLLANLAVRSQVGKADLDLLRSLPRRLQIRLFTELVPSVGGSHRQHLTALARETGLVEAAERLCASTRWWKRLRGVRLLTALGGGETVVPALFRDPHPAVRAEAVEWAGDHPEPDIVNQLVGLLATPEVVGSWVLRDSLLRIGRPAIKLLARFLETHWGAETEAALDVAAGLPDPAFAPAALRLCGDPVPSVRARAASLAGALGGGQGVEALEKLLADPEPQVRAAAAAALGRLGHWPAAPAIARLLEDAAFVARSQGALGLRRLGSPGLLLLRRALESPDRFAADIARQVLDMPETTADRDQWR